MSTVITINDNTPLTYIKALKRLCGSKKNHYGWLLDHGQEFRGVVLPAGYKRGKFKECFRNAGLLALENSGLTYVEGYASSFIPLHHAWCVDKSGRVIDPTWTDPEHCGYFGVPIRTSYLRKRVLETKVWGLLYVNERAFIPPKSAVAVLP